MGLKGYLLQGSEWDQANHIKHLTPAVRGGYCRALVICWLKDCVTNPKITVTANFKYLIQAHTGNLAAIAKSQEDTDKIDGINGLQTATLHLLQVSAGTLSINDHGGTVWYKSVNPAVPGQQVMTALNNSTTTPRTCIVHLEWDSRFFGFGGGAHAIGVISETGSSPEVNYTVFDPNYGILRADGDAAFLNLIEAIRSCYSVDRLMAMPLMG